MVDQTDISLLETRWKRASLRLRILADWSPDLASKAAPPLGKGYAHFAWRYERARKAFHAAPSDAAFARWKVVCDLAESELLRFASRSSSNPADGADTVEAVVLADWPGWAPEAVAHFEGVTVERVREIRRLAGVDPGRGDGADDIGERDRQIVELRNDGLALRAIGMRTGVSHETVRKVLTGTNAQRVN